MPVLAWKLKKSPTSDIALICGSDGQPLAKNFRKYFCGSCNKAGVLKLTHSLRKIGATRAANARATVAQLKALFGWTDDVMPSLYTKSADRVRLAKEAITKPQK